MKEPLDTDHEPLSNGTYQIRLFIIIAKTVESGNDACNNKTVRVGAMLPPAKNIRTDYK